MTAQIIERPRRQPSSECRLFISTMIIVNRQERSIDMEYNHLEPNQQQEEQKLRERSKNLNEEPGIVSFHAEDIVDGETFIDSEPNQDDLFIVGKVTISLNGEEKYISIFDLDMGKRIYLEDDEVERLLKDKFLHLTFKAPLPEG